MIEIISEWILNIIISEADSNERKKILLFGITRFVEDIPKTILIVIVCSLLGLIKELGMTFAILIIYKANIGGVHCKTNLGCFINTLLFFLICVYASNYIIFEGIIKTGVYTALYILGLYTIWVYVPADVPEIPVIADRVRKRAKIVSFILLNLLYILAIKFIKKPEYQNIIIYTVSYINIMATRTIYKLFKNKYGYEDYTPDELMIMD